MKVGDYVKMSYVSDKWYKGTLLKKGDIGTIKNIDKRDNTIGIEFLKKINGHDLQLAETIIIKCKKKHGYWIQPQHLKPATPTEIKLYKQALIEEEI